MGINKKPSSNFQIALPKHPHLPNPIHSQNGVYLPQPLRILDDANCTKTMFVHIFHHTSSVAPYFPPNILLSSVQWIVPIQPNFGKSLVKFKIATFRFSANMHNNC